MSSQKHMRCPWPWPGGKRRVADVVWRAFGPDVPNYIEPFFGSGAVLLGRPGGAGKIETINDVDGGVVNAYRAIKAQPAAVAAWCDWPVSELDVHARHDWLRQRIDELAEQLRADPEYFDPKFAGWWLYGIAAWIGTGWCGGIKRGHPRPNLNGGQGVHALGQNHKGPNLTNSGVGVHALGPHQRPHLSSDNGVHKMPDVYYRGGKGVLGTSLPSIGNDRGLNGVSAPPCIEWFQALAARLRRVRIVCGDWTRVLGPSVLGKGKNVGGRTPTAVFFDCPYDDELRTKRIYNHDDGKALSTAVREWAIANGDDPQLRIAVCGYKNEHEFPKSWTVHEWTGARGYAGEDNDNRTKETIWFSKHCLSIEQQRSLFEGLA